MTAVAVEFGLSPNGLAKICDRLDLKRPPKGFWKAGVQADIEGLVSELSDPDEMVRIGGKTSASRRARTRMSLEDRQTQMIDEAKRIAKTKGLHEVSLRTIARNLGISEAQAHNCFSTREDLLEEIAFREQEAFELVRQEARSRGKSRISKTILSAVAFLQNAARRGPILNQILADSKISQRVARRRDRATRHALRSHVSAVLTETGVSPEVAVLKTKMHTAMIRKTGELVAKNYISLQQAERLLVPTLVEVAIEQKSG